MSTFNCSFFYSSSPFLIKRTKKKRQIQVTSSSLSGHVNQGASGLKSYLLVTNGEKNPSNSVYSQRFDHVLHISFFFLFFYLFARLGCAMKKCQKVWFPWQKPSTYGRLLETFHMVLKEKKKLIKIFHFLLHSLSLSVCLCSSWVWRILSHDCWGEFWFNMFCYNSWQ